MCCRADLDGRLLGAPELQGIECFSGAENGLKPVAVDAWGPLIFVNMTAAMTDDGALSLAMCCAAVMLANGDDTAVAVALHDHHLSPGSLQSSLGRLLLRQLPPPRRSSADRWKAPRAPARTAKLKVVWMKIHLWCGHTAL